jgi:hypothetical protein
MAALQAALTSAWIAARELSPARRRATRAGIVAAVGAVAYAVSPDPAEGERELVVGKRPTLVAEGGPVVDPEFTFDKRKAVLAAAVLGVSAATIYGRRQLEKRWLARLTRSGHPHPTRALAVRMAGVEFGVQLALQLADLSKVARAGGSSGSPAGR